MNIERGWDNTDPKTKYSEKKTCPNVAISSTTDFTLTSLGSVAYPGIFFGGGGSTNSVEDRENGDLGSVAP
jgi:hypothetical protein